MEKRLIDGIEVQRSSGNVYADLDLPVADKLKIKTGLTIEIRMTMRRIAKESSNNNLNNSVQTF